MDFYNGQALLDLCEKENILISAAMKEREVTMGTLTGEEVDSKLVTVLEIMRNSSHRPIEKPGKSIGGLIGGEAKMVNEYGKTAQSIAGSMLSKAISYSMAVI